MSLIAETPKEQSIIDHYTRLLEEKTTEYEEYVTTSKEIEAELYVAIDEVVLIILFVRISFYKT
jgi:hypothetical protein